MDGSQSISVLSALTGFSIGMTCMFAISFLGTRPRWLAMGIVCAVMVVSVGVLR